MERGPSRPGPSRVERARPDAQTAVAPGGHAKLDMEYEVGERAPVVPQESESLTRADEMPILDRPDRQRSAVLHKLSDPLGHPAVQILAIEELDLVRKTG